MKKIFLFISILCFCSNSLFAQGNTFFDCTEFYSDLKKFNALGNYSNRSRAKAIMELEKMNRENAIHWQYVIIPRDFINIELFMKTVKRWQKQAFQSEKVVKEETESSILYEAYSPKVAYITGYMSATTISVNLLLKIEAKEDRIRVTGNVRHYNMGTANLIDGANSKLIVVGEAFPFVNTKKKESFSMAYINSNVRLINLMANIHKNLRFLCLFNKNQDHSPYLCYCRSLPEEWDVSIIMYNEVLASKKLAYETSLWS